MRKCRYMQLVADVFQMLLICLFLLSPPAQAYVDATTGSYMIQVVLGGLLGASVWLKAALKRFSTKRVERYDDLR